MDEFGQVWAGKATGKRTNTTGKRRKIEWLVRRRRRRRK